MHYFATSKFIYIDKYMYIIFNKTCLRNNDFLQPIFLYPRVFKLLFFAAATCHKDIFLVHAYFYIGINILPHAKF